MKILFLNTDENKHMLPIYLKICCLRLFREHYDTFRCSKLKTLYIFKLSHLQLMIGYTIL